MEYNFPGIEKHWKQYWADNQVYKVTNDTTKPKYYILDMFPYPSGAGLHVGHPLGYIASDIYARYKRLCGYNVLHPMGFDAFGLPAEQYAIETGQHPAVTTEKNIARYREQLDNIGFCYDWDRQVRTSEPNYYKWTQWIFLQLFHSWYNRQSNKACPLTELIAIFEKEGNTNHPCPGDAPQHFDAAQWNQSSEKEQREILMKYRLAYQGFAQVWWCEALGTVLANDEVVNGVSERGGHPVERKNMRQWFLRITEFADRLLSSLDALDWSEPMKEMQRNWIGKSTGAIVSFDLSRHGGKVEVFTTRPDTIFGVDFLVLAPEHALVSTITTPEQKSAIDSYVQYVKGRSERERQAEVKSVTGCFTGAYVIHPLNNNLVPIWISEYVLAGYGTGAIMGVPSGDERDHRFAKHFNIPITNIFGDLYTGEDAYSDKVGTIQNSGFISGMTIADAAATVIDTLEKLEKGTRKVNYRLRDAGFSRQRYWGEPFPIAYINDIPYGTDEDPIASNPALNKLPVELPMVENYKPGPEGQGPLANISEWVNVVASPPAPLHKWRGEHSSDAIASGEGLASHEGGTSDLKEHKALADRASYVPKYGIKTPHPFEIARGNRKNATNAEEVLWGRLRSTKTGEKFRRQHPVDAYFADFICLQRALIIELDGDYHNGPQQQVLDNERTKTLEDIGFKVLRFTNDEVLHKIEFVIEKIKSELSSRPKLMPEPSGYRVSEVDPENQFNKSILFEGKSEDLQQTGSEYHVTPSPFMEKGPGVEAHRETNTMPGYAGSSWYFLRYMDPHNDNEFASRKATDYWRQVDLYIGGTEHAVGHLLYSRMWTKALCDLGFIGFDEPFRKLLNQGMITGNSRFVYIIHTHAQSPEEDTGAPYLIFVSKNIVDIVSDKNHEQNEQVSKEFQIVMDRIKPPNSVFSLNFHRVHVHVKYVDGILLDTLTFLHEKNDNVPNPPSYFILDDLSVESRGEQSPTGKYICGAEVEKMSKSKYNVVNPDDIVAQYGADTFRMYEMFLGPIEMSKPWDTKGIEGVHRFLKKMWRLYADDQKGWIVTDEAANDTELRLLHKTIKKISEDIERFSFNTSVSQFMITVNELSTLGCHKRAILEPLVIMICPFAPHIAEELWHKLGHTDSVVAAQFPAFEEKYVTENTKNYPVAVNGKPRAEMEFPLDAEKAEVEKAVLANEIIQKWLEGKAPKNFIYVKGKMINVVI